MFETRYKSHHDAEHEYTSLVKKDRSSQAELDAYLNTPNIVSKKENAIYIHIPFCDRICSFCNMNRKQLDGTLDSYVEELIAQIKWMGNHLYFEKHDICAVYFGGGTPTVLSPSHFEHILRTLHEVFTLRDDCEITCETTLHNLSDAHLAMFKNIGINRISIGIQTFQSEGRKFFNRTYDKATVLKRLQDIRQMFDGCLSIDKIYNYPGETQAMLLDDIKQIIETDVDSISFYSLMIHKGSKLSEHLDASHFSNEQDQVFHDLFIEMLMEHGDFEFLELTKIARKGRDRYRYMDIRNKNGNTIPLGRGAGGQIDQFQIYNVDFNRVMVVKSMDDNNEVANHIYGVCQYPVIDKAALAMFAEKQPAFIPKGVLTLVETGYLEDQGDVWNMSEKGIFYGNNIGGFLARTYLELQDEEK